MPVRKDDDGRRFVEAEVDVPGTPEEVWQAIASGKGISSWFVPTTVEEGEGGKSVSNFGPGMDSVAEITQWNPHQNYTAEAEVEGLGKVATEWTVEARDGGKCVVRVIHRWFADSDDWDGQFEGHAYGWSASFFRILRLYLTHFAGQTCSAFDLSAFSQTSGPETWQTVKGAFHLDPSSRRVESSSGSPLLSGTIESLEVTDPDLLRIRETSPLMKATLEGMDGENPELLLRLDQPAPGLAHLFTMALGQMTMVSLRVFYYGDQGAAVVEDSRNQWSRWLAERFPQAGSE